MSGIPDDWSLTEVVKKAILAGNDFILIGNNIKYRPEVIKTMLEDIGDSVAKGDIPAERIRESYRKIVSFKRKLANNNLTHLKALQCTDAEMTKYWSEIIRQPDEEDRGLLKEKNLNPDDWGSANLILSPE
jgi:beta-glucosidase-like glycosyl hydrolase